MKSLLTNILGAGKAAGSALKGASISPGQLLTVGMAVGGPLMFQDHSKSPEERARQTLASMVIGASALRFKSPLAAFTYQTGAEVLVNGNVGGAISGAIRGYAESRITTRIPFSHSKSHMDIPRHLLETAAQKLGATYGGEAPYIAKRYLHVR